MSGELVRVSSGDVPSIIAAAGAHAVEEYRAFLDGRKWSRKTRALYGQRTRHFFFWAEARRLSLDSIKANDLEAYASAIASVRSRHAAIVHLTPVRGLFRHLVEAGVLMNSPLNSAQTAARGAVGRETPSPSNYVEELQALRRKAWATLEARYQGDPTFELVKSIERQLAAIRRVQVCGPDATSRVTGQESTHGR